MEILSVIFSVVPTLITIVVGRIVMKIDKRSEKEQAEREKKEIKKKKEYEALKNGVLAILRDRIIQADMRFTERGMAMLSQKENVQMMYEAYHNLGGNGVVTRSYEHVMNLPIAQEGDAQ